MTRDTQMGIYDRDYYRDGNRGAFGAPALRSVTVWLIVVNVLLFVIDGLIERRAFAFDAGPIARWGYFSMDRAVYGGEVWRLVTFQFLHAGAGHLALNMLALAIFGPIVEAHFGARRFVAYYLLCGVAGAVMYIILWAGGLVITSAAVPLVGASAGVLGVMVAASQFAPDLTVPLLYFPFPLRLRTVIWVALIGAALILLRQGINAGGEAAHLGGIVCGFVLVFNQHLLSFVEPARRATVISQGRRRPKRVQKDWSKDFNR